jgi:hypothetical protein
MGRRVKKIKYRMYNKMIKYFKPVIFIIAIFCFCSGTFGQVQNNELKAIADKFLQYCETVPREEIYVQSDREEYIAGEEFWFDIYLIDRQSTKPSNRSKIVYIELLNPENTPVAQKRIKIESGNGPGQFTLPDTLTAGNYILRAYTNFMKNSLPGNCFMKKISIYNYNSPKSYKDKILIEKLPNRNINIEYFPEGGTMFYGILTKLAVRVSDQYGQGIQYTGLVQNEMGDSITSFITDNYGIGAFEIIPESGKKYMVLVNENMDRYFSYLPEPLASGIMLKVNDQNTDDLEIFVTSDDNYRSVNGSTIQLFIQTYGTINFMSTKQLTGLNTKFTIPKSTLTSGINQITLFDSKGQPVCERFVYTPERVNNQITIIAPDSSGKRNKVIIEIELNKELVSSLNKANLSISVTPKTNNQKLTYINDYLIFGTEFENLPWLGKSKMKLADLPLDILNDFLISAKSSWIDWGKILSGKTDDVKYKIEEEDHYLYGKLENMNISDSNADQYLFMSVPGKDAVFQSAKTDKDGFFSFNLKIDEFPKDLIIQPADLEKNPSVRLESSFPDKYFNPINLPVLANGSIPGHILKWSVNYQVEKIFGNSSLGNPLTTPVVQPRPLRFYGKPDRELFLADFIELPVMQEVFFELLPGVTLKVNKSIYSFSIIDPVIKKALDYSPILMIDGVMIDDAGLIANLDPQIVEKIDVVKSEYVVGELIFYGLINVITKASDFNSVPLPEYVTRLPYRIYDPIMSFISPDYSKPEILQSRIPDFRNTLYWNPSVKPDNDGKATCEFWTSDYPAEYEVTVQGLTNQGIPISTQKSINIK